VSKFWLLSIGLLLANAAYAKEDANKEKEIEIPSPWDTQVEFGYQAHSGNTTSESLNSRLRSEYTSGRYRTNGDLKYYRLEKNGKETKRQSTYSLQSDYKLGTDTYLYGSFKGMDSQYTAYFKDYTVSGGLGYQVENSKELLLEVELGPGYRYQEPNLDEIDDDDIVFPDVVQEPIFRTNIRGYWQVLDNLKLGIDATHITGKSNAMWDTDISVTNNITEDIALKISQSRQYHNKVPEGLSKADSIFSINLLFIF